MKLLSQQNKLIRAHDLLFKSFIPAEKIAARVAELGQMISGDYADKKPVFITILNGAFIFLADLVRHFDFPCEITFIKLSSYEGVASTGKVATLIGMDMNLKGRNVIIVEDIIDTGETIFYFLKELEKQEPASVKIASLLLKPEALRHEFPIDYKGFDIPNKFVIGYGLDYNGEGRNFPDIYQLVDGK